MNITVLGAGSFGCSIATIANDNGHEVNLWGHLQSDIDKLKSELRNPFIPEAEMAADINYTSDLSVINDSEIIAFVVPSFAIREVAKSIKEILEPGKNPIYVICTKGLEAKTMKSGHTIIEEEIGEDSQIVTLSGPTHAEEVALRMFTTIVSTSESEYARKTVQKAFNNQYLRVYTNPDVRGVEIIGAAKNVLAIAAGYCDGNDKLGDNAKAALLTRGLRELKIIGDLENCQPETFYGLTGMGDLIVTAMSRHSRNRGFGELLGQGLTKEEAAEKIGMVVEGVYSVEAIHQLKDKHNLDLPIIEAIYQLLYEGGTFSEVFETLATREIKSEI